MATLKLFIIFILIVSALNKKILVGHIFIAAAFILGIFFSMPLAEILPALLKSAIAPHAIGLTTLVTLLLILSNSMRECGHLERMLNCVRQTIHNQRLRLTLFPALIGLLPMPGGAIFSAPMVKELSQDKYSPTKLVFINYWFRHIWEYWWPLYPGVLLLTALSGLPIEKYSVTAMPLTIPAVLLGLLYLPKEKGDTTEKQASSNYLVLLKHLTPILIAIIPGFFLGSCLAKIFPGLPVPREIGLATAIIVANVYVWLTTPHSKQLVPKIIFNKHNVSMGYTALSIMVFKGMLDHSNAVQQIANELNEFNVPLLLVLIILPIITGLITGITIGFVGTSFPILISLLQTILPDESILPYMVLSLACGFVGTLLSPMHLCLILSNQYFGASQSAIYRYLIIPCVGMIVVALGYFFILKSIF